MTKTPETDAAEFPCMTWPSHDHPMVVRAEYARELKRERDEAREALAAEIKHHTETTAKWNGHHMDLTIVQCDLNKAIRQRDEARAEIAGWENKWKVAVEMAAVAENERDILRSNKMSDPLLETTLKHLIRERDEARAEMIRWMSIAEGRGRTDHEEENDTQSELAAWEMLTEATRERDEARAMACDMRNQFEKESTSRLLFPWENDQANPPATHPSL